MTPPEHRVTDDFNSESNDPDRQLATIIQELRHIRILLTCLLCLAVLSAAASVGGYLIDKFLPFIFWIGLTALVVFAIYYGVRHVWKFGEETEKTQDRRK
jgi:hypothetical protein